MSKVAINSKQVRGLQSPSASWAEPFEMLEACHARVIRMLNLLEKMQYHLRTNGIDAQVRQAAVDVTRYFDNAAPQHHLDEELHIFPRALDSGDPKVIVAVNRLLEQHREMEVLWQALREQLDLLANPQASSQPFSEPSGDALVQKFSTFYLDHISVEEQVVYPSVQKGVTGDDLQLMGREMAARRGAQVYPESPTP